jgi:hypothetical protein
MNPSSLLNVSSDLLREHVRHDMHSAPMAPASDRTWCIWVCVAFAAAAGVLILLLH